jgi:hypothetical protein
VDAHEALRLLQALAQLLERDARRVGCEDRGRLHLRLDARIDLALEIEHLGHRFDDEVGADDALAAQVRNEAIECVARGTTIVAADPPVELSGTLGRAGER